MLRANALAQGNNTIRSETKIVLVDAVVTDKKATFTVCGQGFDSLSKTTRSKRSPAFQGKRIPRRSPKRSRITRSFSSTIPAWIMRSSGVRVKLQSSSSNQCRLQTNDRDRPLSGRASGGAELYWRYRSSENRLGAGRTVVAEA